MGKVCALRVLSSCPCKYVHNQMVQRIRIRQSVLGRLEKRLVLSV